MVITNGTVTSTGPGRIVGMNPTNRRLIVVGPTAVVKRLLIASHPSSRRRTTPAKRFVPSQPFKALAFWLPKSVRRPALPAHPDR
jgi:hypothetical protein